MSAPAAFLTALASRDLRLMRWIEIEGIPYGYGMWNSAAMAAPGAAWFSARAAGDQFLGIKQALLKVPPIEDPDLDVLEGFAARAGQVEFHIGDFDGEPTRWTGVGAPSFALREDITAAGTTIRITPTSNNGEFSVGSYAYIGNETVEITAMNDDQGTADEWTVTRARFRSKAKAWGAGTPIGEYPWTMAKRRVWLYLVAALQSEAFADANKVLRWLGRLEDYRLNETLGAYIAKVSSIEKELSDPVFRNLRTVSSAGESIADAFGKDGSVAPSGTPGINSTRNELASPEVRDPEFSALEKFALRVDDEIFRCQRVDAACRLLGRGLCNTAPAAHKGGFVGKEAVIVCEGDDGNTAGLPQDSYASKFTSAKTSDSIAPADHPLIVLLQVLLSTGDGTNTLGIDRRNYDVLPKDWGRGVDVSRVDVTAIEALANDRPYFRCGGVIEDEVNFVDLAKSLLKPFGYYATQTFDGLWTVKYLRPPLPDEALRTIDSSAVNRERLPGYDSNLTGPVERIDYKFGWDIVDKRFRRVETIVVSEARLYTDGNGRKLTHECKLIYGTDGIRGEPRRLARLDLTEVTKDRFDFWRLRFARPPPVVTEEVLFNFLDIEHGELILLTESNLPNPEIGTRGITEMVAEVFGKRVDEDEKLIELKLLLTGWQIGTYRFIAPSLEIESVVNTSKFVAKANSFTMPAGPTGQTQTDLRFEKSGGALVDAFGTSGDAQKVKLWSADFGTGENVLISAIDFATREVTLSAVPALALAAGQWVTWRDYDANGNASVTSETIKDRYAFFSDSDLRLGAQSDVGHLYFPS